VLVSQHLDFHMSWFGNVAFDVDLRVSEVCLRFAARPFEGAGQFVYFIDDPNASPASASGRFDRQGETELAG